jgi:hypothetical protein
MQPTVEMQKRAMHMLLTRINEPMKEYFEIKHEKHSLVLYEVSTSGLVDPDNKPIHKVTKVKEIFEGSIKSLNNYLSGMIAMNALGGMLSKKYHDVMVKMKEELQTEADAKGIVDAGQIKAKII